MGLDLEEWAEMYSDDPKIRRNYRDSLPITISRGEYYDLLGIKRKYEKLTKTKKSTQKS